MLPLEEAKAPTRTQSAPPSARRRAESRGRGGQWNTPLLLPQEAVPPPTARGPARAETEEEAAVFGLSTTVANERLVEQIEAVVGEFLELVKVVTWRARLSFLQTQEGAIAPLVVLALVVFAVLTGDTWLVGEVLLILPFHLLAWYISFRLPRAEQLRAIAKVQDCVQRFVTSDDAFTQTGAAPYNPMPMEAVPPSAVCVSVLRDRVWRHLPYNMVVEGDLFKLREGETFPCQAERLIMRPEGAVPSGQVLRAGDVFAPAGAVGEDPSVPVVSSFRARTTACVPLVRKFLQSAQRSSAGRMDTVFFELATLVRGRLKKLSLTAFVFSMAASGLWLLQPAVMEQSITWHLHRFLLPVRLILCLLPLLPAILLQVTDIWGNARIQSLFQWHAGLSDEERSGAKPKGRIAESCEDEQSLGSGDLDASRVPLQWQLKELFEILGQGLEGQANLMHTLNSTTVVCFCDREGLLTDTCTSVAEVCLCSSRRPRKQSVFSEGACSHSRAPSEIEEEQRAQTSEGLRSRQRSPSKREGAEVSSRRSCERTPATPEERAESSKTADNEESDVTFSTVVLDVQSDNTSACGLRFEDADWRNYLSSLKPLGLSMAVSRQPREPPSSPEGPELFRSMAGDFLCALHRGTCAAMHDCSCNMSQLIGFRDDVVGSFADVKFCMEFCRPQKLQALPPHQRSETSMAPEQRIADASPNTIATQARPHTAWRAAPSPQSGSEPSPLSDVRDPRAPPVTSQLSKSSQETANGGEEADSTRRVEDEGPRFLDAGPNGPTNFSQTILTWFVEDPRDGSYQMFSKGKPKRLLPRCTHYFDGHEVLPLTEEDKQCLTRLVLQWKASGLVAVAYSYRPLSSQAETDIPMQLEKNTFFCATEDDEGDFRFVQAGRSGETVREKSPAAGAGVPGARMAQAWQELQSEQVLLGMVGAKLCASVQMPSYAEALQTAGIRFQVYSVEGEKRTRTLGSQLGLETGWNCLISLEPSARQVKNMMGQVVLPSGIAKIRRHVKEVDNVPLLVSLYSKATPWRAQQMISIMQEHAECVTCVGSALQPNFEIFRQASISVSVLVNSVPQCRRCFGRRAPRPAGSAGSDELLVNNMVNRAEFQLSADLTSLPCALQARHSFSNGEQRTLEVLFNAIKEARRCVDCILMVLIHYICGAVELSVIVSLQSLLCLPPPMEGFHVLAILLLLLPLLSVCLLFNAASPQIMKELPLKKADEKTLAQPGRLMLLYALRSVPSALVVGVAFVQDLHLQFSSHLHRALMNPDRPEQLVEMCQGFSWTWWLTGRWPRCSKAVHEVTTSGAALGSLLSWEHGSCTLAHAQQWSAWLFILYEVTLAFTFLDRYDSLVTRGPSSNKVLNSMAFVTLLLHLVVSCSIVLSRCKGDPPQSLVPSVQQWLLYVALWPVLAVLVSEGTKRRDRRYHMHLQKTLRVLFNTRLGMWSPK